MNQNPTILFDLDGTLLDTAPEFTHCLNTMLTALNLPLVNEADLRPHVSRGAQGMCEYALGPHVEPERFQEYKNQFLAIYHQSLGAQTRLFAGIAEVLNYLNERSIAWGIVTNKFTLYAQPLVALFPEFLPSKTLVCGDTLDESKPSGKPLRHALELMNRTAEPCWYVGDAQTDVMASRNAQMKSCVAVYGYIPFDQDPLNWQADQYIAHPKELLNLLDDA